jgi:predicted amidohydrolase
MNPDSLAEFLRVGLVQTTVDNTSAWANSLHMSRMEEERAIAEIQLHLFSLGRQSPKPELVVFPELAVPLGFLPRLRKAAASLNTVLVAGMDFQLAPPANGQAVNRAAVIVPDGWGKSTRSSRTSLRYVGKTYPAYKEREHLKQLGYDFRCIPEVWVFDAGRFGRFAVAVCYDFLDLERVAMYRLNVQHLFVVSYNQDLTSFDHAAEALARMIFCNVVICNTGTYGGSLAVSPYLRPERRLIYRHSGSKLSTSQTISLPVKALRQAQLNAWPAGKEREFKSLPPGSEGTVRLKAHSERID